MQNNTVMDSTQCRKTNFVVVRGISIPAFKVSVKENEVPTEKNSSRASIFATKASYTSN